MAGSSFRTASLILAPLLLFACRGEEDPVEGVVVTPSGPVVDIADVIPADAEAMLDERLREYWDEERTAIVVNTIETLDGQTIEKYAFETFAIWGIGDAETNRGVLIVLAMDEREARIEVGCGLETVLTNVVANRIMRDRMLPEFREGDFPGGIEAGVDGIEEALAADSVEPGPVSPLCRDLAA